MFYYRFVCIMQSSNSIWKTIESHRWVKVSCENIGMRLSYVPFTLVKRLINFWDFIQIWYDNNMFSSQWDNNNQHFVYIIFIWYLLGIITCQGFLFSCSCINGCICYIFDIIQTSTLRIIRSTNNMTSWFICKKPYWDNSICSTSCLCRYKVNIYIYICQIRQKQRRFSGMVSGMIFTM